jgi:hypothetical protein
MDCSPAPPGRPTSRARELIAAPVAVTDPPAEHDDADLAAGAEADHRPPCPCCGGRMVIVETFQRGAAPRGPPSPKPRSGPRCHDAHHRLIAPSACRGTRFRRRIAVVPPPPTARPIPPIRLKSPCRLRGDAKLATAIVDPPLITPASTSTTQAAASSNPHRRQAVARPPRVPSGEAFGRRPSARADRSRRAGIRNPSPSETFRTRA